LKNSSVCAKVGLPAEIASHLQTIEKAGKRSRRYPATANADQGPYCFLAGAFSCFFVPAEAVL
jgi:hypothetical protein